MRLGCSCLHALNRVSKHIISRTASARLIGTVTERGLRAENGHTPEIEAFSKRIIFEDNHILVVNKEISEVVQGASPVRRATTTTTAASLRARKEEDRRMDGRRKGEKQYARESLFHAASEYVRKSKRKKGNAYLGVVHRLDRGTSGVVIFAKTSKAAARLGKAFLESSANGLKERERRDIDIDTNVASLCENHGSNGSSSGKIGDPNDDNAVRKTYICIVDGSVPAGVSGTLMDLLTKETSFSYLDPLAQSTVSTSFSALSSSPSSYTAGTLLVGARAEPLSSDVRAVRVVRVLCDGREEREHEQREGKETEKSTVVAPRGDDKRGEGIGEAAGTSGEHKKGNRDEESAMKVVPAVLEFVSLGGFTVPLQTSSPRIPHPKKAYNTCTTIVHDSPSLSPAAVNRSISRRISSKGDRTGSSKAGAMMDDVLKVSEYDGSGSGSDNGSGSGGIYDERAESEMGGGRRRHWTEGGMGGRETKKEGRVQGRVKEEKDDSIGKKDRFQTMQGKFDETDLTSSSPSFSSIANALEQFSILIVRPKTGRKHQIRAQLAHRGMTICGDGQYGSGSLFAAKEGFALHAHAISFPHPVSKKKMTLTASFPSTWRFRFGDRVMDTLAERLLALL